MCMYVQVVRNAHLCCLNLVSSYFLAFKREVNDAISLLSRFVLDGAEQLQWSIDYHRRPSMLIYIIIILNPNDILIIFPIIS